MMIVPPVTEEFALVTAISTCGLASDRVGSIKVPKLKSCVFIDTLSSNAKLKTDMRNAKSYIGRALPKGFKRVTAQDVCSSNPKETKLSNDDGDTFEYVSRLIANKYSDVQEIFVTLDSVIYGPNNFEKAEFDKFLAWAAEIKKQGKTLVLMSQYQIPQTKYLADHMNFVINCIPDQRGAASGMCAFAVQWLSLKVTTDSDVDLIANQNQIKIGNPHFTLSGETDYDKKRCWYQLAYMGC